jgi:hypothetical protein
MSSSGDTRRAHAIIPAPVSLYYPNAKYCILYYFWQFLNGSGSHFNFLAEKPGHTHPVELIILAVSGSGRGPPTHTHTELHTPGGVVECASLPPASSSLTHARRMDGFCNQNADQLGYLAGPSRLTVRDERRERESVVYWY